MCRLSWHPGTLRACAGFALPCFSLPFICWEMFRPTWPSSGNTFGVSRSIPFSHFTTAPSGPRPLRCRGLTITLRLTTVGRTPLHEWSARRSYLYLPTHNSPWSQTSMSPAGFEPAIPASERPQIHALDRAATGTHSCSFESYKKKLDIFVTWRVNVYRDVYCWCDFEVVYIIVTINVRENMALKFVAFTTLEVVMLIV